MAGAARGERGNLIVVGGIEGQVDRRVDVAGSGDCHAVRLRDHHTWNRDRSGETAHHDRRSGHVVVDDDRPGASLLRLGVLREETARLTRGESRRRAAHEQCDVALESSGIGQRKAAGTRLGGHDQPGDRPGLCQRYRSGALDRRLHARDRRRRVYGHARRQSAARYVRGGRDCRAGDARRARDVREVAFVAGRGRDDDADRGGIVGRDRRRIGRFAERRAEAHVDHVEVIAHVAVAVRVHRPLDRLRSDVGTAAGVAEHLQRVQIGAGCNTLADTARHADAGSSARDVRAMAVAVQRISIGLRHGSRIVRVVSRAGEVEAALDLRGRKRAGLDDVLVVRDVLGNAAAATEVGVRVVDAGVDDADADVLAAADLGPHRRRADPRHALDVVYRVQLDAPHRAYARHLAQRCDLGRADLHAKAVRADALRRQDLRAQPFERRPEARLLLRHALSLCALRSRRSEAAACAQTFSVELGDRGLGETHEHLHATIAVYERRAVELARVTCIDIAFADGVRSLRDRGCSDERCCKQHRRHSGPRPECVVIHRNIPVLVCVLARMRISQRLQPTLLLRSGEFNCEERWKKSRRYSSRSQSRGRRKSAYNFASGEPACGCQSYSQRASGGSDIRIDSVRPPDCRPNEVPRS